MFRSFSKAETLADGFIFSLACARAGIPVLLISPQGGGKSTIIQATKKWLINHKHRVIEVSRIGLRTLAELSSELIRSKRIIMLNDDYSNIGDSEYMVGKMGELITALSYSKGFYDYGLKVNIQVEKFGFVSGVQPLWLKSMMTSRVFATNIREKFIRYYLLPHRPTKDIRLDLALKLLVENQGVWPQNEEVKIPSSFIEALAVQVGEVRAWEFAERLVEELKTLYPIWKLPKLLRYFSTRIKFEEKLVEKELERYGYSVEVFWRAYTVLFWCLRRGGVTRTDLLRYLGVSSLRSADDAINEAFTKGWIVETPTRNKKYLPNYEIFKGG